LYFSVSGEVVILFQARKKTLVDNVAFLEGSKRIISGTKPRSYGLADAAIASSI
jgi:hypothetical protein